MDLAEIKTTLKTMNTKYSVIYQDKQLSYKRVDLAIQALNLGGDPVEICKLLDWREFEELSKRALQLLGYEAIRNFIFTIKQKRYQIDVVGVKGDLLLFLDCKHWIFSKWSSKLPEISQKHYRKIEGLRDNPDLIAKKFSLPPSVYLMPMILTLDIPLKSFVNDIPIVSVLQLKDFLEKIHDYWDICKVMRIEK